MSDPITSRFERLPVDSGWQDRDDIGDRKTITWSKVRESIEFFRELRTRDQSEPANPPAPNHQPSLIP